MSQDRQTDIQKIQMDDPEATPRKKQRLLDASNSAPVGGAIRPAVPPSIVTDTRGIGAPQSPFPSILESGGDAADSDLYESDDDEGGEDGSKAVKQRKMAVQDGGTAIKVMLPAGEAAAATLAIAGSSGDAKAVGSTGSFFVADIPGLFLLEKEGNTAQPIQADMDDSEQQLVTEVPQATGAAEGDIVMGESAVDQPGKMSEDVEMRVDGGRQTEDMGIQAENRIVSNEQTAKQAPTESIDHSRENHAATPGPAETTSVILEETTTTSEVLPSATDKPILLTTNDENMLERPIKEEETERPRGKAAYDPDFLAAAEANKGSEGAEWQFDSSDAESSEGEEDSDSEGSGSDEDSEDGSDSDAEDAEFPRLSLAEQAKILMADAGEDGEQSNSKGEVLRTKNEQLEDAIEIKKPDVVLTEADPLEELGEVQSVVERLALIKAKTSGEYQVLNEGSVVALQDRTVIGTIADLLGRVQSPLYTVRFATKEEISENGITVGTKIFYSPKHSTFVFTKALKAQKGSDASNLWDEEVDEHEIEFSDDEAEAEYKRKLKEKKAGGKGGKAPHQRDAQGPGRSGAGAPSSDEPYTPLARPPHLSDLMKEMAHIAQPVEKNPNRGDHGDKNKGDARKAGRGGNRGGRDERRSGGRDNGRGPNERRGHGYNRDRDRGRDLTDQAGSPSASQPYYGSGSHSPHGYQQPPPAPTYQQPQQAYQQAQSTPQYGYHYGGYTSQQYSQLPQQPQQPLQPLHQQLSFQYQTQPGTQAQASFQHQNAGHSQAFASSSTIPKLPQGAHVNPAFFARQAQSAQQQAAYFNPQMMWGQQQQQQQQQQQYQQNSPPPAQSQFSWPPPPVPPQQADAVMKAVQDQLDILKGVRKQ